MNLSPVKSYSALLITGISLTLFCLPSFIPRTAPRFILNSSSSLPRGLYVRAEKQAITSGSLILFSAPTNARSYVYGRGWLPEGWPLMKTVAGLPGDIYCITDEQIVVNHRSFGPVFRKDREGRDLPALRGCHTVEEGSVLPLTAASPTTFDGRYFGTISRASILAVLEPFAVITPGGS